MIYKPGAEDLIICNTPPEHAKSTTITVNYTIWRICQDPNVKIIVVSKTRDMAMKFLAQIKGILTGRQYELLQQHFAPVEGWDHDSVSWT